MAIERTQRYMYCWDLKVTANRGSGHIIITLPCGDYRVFNAVEAKKLANRLKAAAEYILQGEAKQEF